MESRSAHLLRYRFGNLAQMNNHLHVQEGRTLFFWRDPRIALPGGARVVVEFSFSNSEQVAIARGSVLARSTEGPLTGLWLDFPDSRLARRIEQGVGGIASRKQRRIGCDLVVEVRSSRAPSLSRLLDVSLGGCRIAGVPLSNTGFDVDLRLLAPDQAWPRELGRAEVVRADSGEIGVRFQRSDPAARVATSKLFQLVQQAWAQAPELTHPPMCCQAGQAIEPPLPYVKKRD